MAAPLRAQEYVTATGLLSDRDFYRLVACAAPPGGACHKPLVRWPSETAGRLWVGITRIDPGFPSATAVRIEGALLRAVEEINALRAGPVLRLDADDPLIPVLLLDMPGGTGLRGTDVAGLDGRAVDWALVQPGGTTGTRCSAGPSS